MSSVKRLNASTDILECLGADISGKILDFLDDPSDLIRATAVSTSWRHFVVTNGLCKHMCVKMFPEVSNVVGIEEIVEFDRLRPDERLKSEHEVYATLARGLSSSVRNDCLAVAISASSTDNFPEEFIQHTLEPGDKTSDGIESYWSSRGESDATVPETLTYLLMAKLCLITEIHVHPFQAFFLNGHPIYSAKSVRFSMGRLAFTKKESESAEEPTSAQQSTQEKYVWTYVSPEFSMAQENRLQKFVLPVPTLCVGGVMQVELLGRVQKEAMDGLYYVCISHVQAVGRPLSSAFDVELSDASGKWTLTHHGEDAGAGEEESPRGSSRFAKSVRGWELMLNRCLAAQEEYVAVSEDEDEVSEDDEANEDENEDDEASDYEEMV